MTFSIAKGTDLSSDKLELIEISQIQVGQMDGKVIAHRLQAAGLPLFEGTTKDGYRIKERVISKINGTAGTLRQKTLGNKIMSESNNSALIQGLVLTALKLAKDDEATLSDQLAAIANQLSSETGIEIETDIEPNFNFDSADDAQIKEQINRGYAGKHYYQMDSKSEDAERLDAIKQSYMGKHSIRAMKADSQSQQETNSEDDVKQQYINKLPPAYRYKLDSKLSEKRIDAHSAKSFEGKKYFLKGSNSKSLQVRTDRSYSIDEVNAASDAGTALLTSADDEDDTQYKADRAKINAMYGKLTQGKLGGMQRKNQAPINLDEFTEV